MEKERNEWYFKFGIFLSMAIFLSLQYVLAVSFIGESDWFRSSSDWLTAFFAGISTAAVVLTALWAKKSFWYTKEKEQADLTFKFIDEWTSLQMVADRVELFKILYPDGNDEWHKRSLAAIKVGDSTAIKKLGEEKQLEGRTRQLLMVLEKLGLSVRYELINTKRIFEYLSLELDDFREFIEMAIKDQRVRSMQAWSETEYLYAMYDKFKNV